MCDAASLVELHDAAEVVEMFGNTFRPPARLSEGPYKAMGRISPNAEAGSPMEKASITREPSKPSRRAILRIAIDEKRFCMNPVAEAPRINAAKYGIRASP